MGALDVRCEKCQIEYELDEARVKPGGVTVKCTNCGHMFKIRKRAITNVGPLPTSPAVAPETQSASKSPPQPPSFDDTGPPEGGNGAARSVGPYFLVRLENGEQRFCGDLATLQESIVLGRLTRDSQVSQTGRHWKRLGDIDTLAPYFVIADKTQTNRDETKLASWADVGIRGDDHEHVTSRPSARVTPPVIPRSAVARTPSRTAAGSAGPASAANRAAPGAGGTAPSANSATRGTPIAPSEPQPAHSASGTGRTTASLARPQIDVGILTIRPDEFRAVLGAFPAKAKPHVYKSASREYTLRHADAGHGEHYTVAVLRQIEQGNGEAQDAARDLLHDLTPKLVLVVGIAGGLPSDVSLGDVVVATRIHDLTVEARETGSTVTYAASGGPIDRSLAASVANLDGRDEIGDWSAGLPRRPAVTWVDGQLYGPTEWQDKLRAQLERHHGATAAARAPMYLAGPIASSDRLVKDPAALFPWITTARNLLGVEMESGGVYRALRERCPMLPIRGISDIVGLRRSEAWTGFACASAAAFAVAFLRTQPVPVSASRGSVGL